NHRYRRVSLPTDSRITTWAGTGAAGFDGDGHTLLQSQFYWPIDVEFTPTLGVFFVDWNNHRIRKIVNG
ncbi:MAG: hypothetical protein IH969_08300, partial [Candidatus Krumholzibacteriota bacterium]|nr:hypothetical protein [Candidatus Krumholzibacteriota bacterium]